MSNLKQIFVLSANSDAEQLRFWVWERESSQHWTHSLMWYFMSHSTVKKNVVSVKEYVSRFASGCSDMAIVMLCMLLEREYYCTENCMICVTSVVSLKTEVKSEAWQGITLCPIPSALPLFMQPMLPSPGYATVVLNTFCWLWLGQITGTVNDNRL